jgi:FtsH-binding integral membrane protein
MRSRVLQAASANSAARWLWYALIGVCLVVVIVIWAFSSPGKFDHRYDKWAELVMLTTILFGYLVKWGWHYRRRPKFWRVYLILLLGHCAVFVPVFSHGWWPIPLFAVVASIEGMALATLIAVAMGEKL